MKIVPIIKESNNNIKDMSKRLKKAYKKGYTQGELFAERNKIGSIGKAYHITRGVTKEITKKTKADDIPYIAGAIGFLTPLPFASGIMLILGKIVNYIIKKLHKF